MPILKCVARDLATFRDGETTAKVEVCVFEGGGTGGREENCPRKLSISATRVV